MSSIALEAPPVLIEPGEARQLRERLVCIVATLLGLGIVLVYSASAIRAGQHGWEMQYLSSQLCWVGLGICGAMVASRVPLVWIRRMALPILLLTLGLLIAVRVPGVGTKVRGAYRWLRVGGFNMQPSELAKLSMVLVMAAVLARRERGALRFFRDVCPAVLLIGLSVGLILVEPDFGTAALVGAVLLSVLLAAGAKIWQVVLTALPGVPVAAYIGWTKFDHIVLRVNAWLAGETDGAGWQPWMSKVALGSGGIWGTGLGQGSAKLYWLPDAHTDFILAIAGQELGLVGAGLIVLLFALFVHQGLQIVRLAPDRFSSLMAFGIVTWIGLQAAFNIAVVTNVVPPKGISLPFVSSGGSGICVALAAIGLLVNVTRHSPAESVDPDPALQGGA